MKEIRKKALLAALPRTVPVLTGFLFLGLAYGVYMQSMGFSFLYPLCMSIAIFGGSLEFVTVSLLMSRFAPLQTLLMALMIQARHFFYGLAMLDKYKGTGKKKAYLIYGLCDETFSLNCSAEPPEDVDRGWYYFFVTLLDQSYWVTGATLGGILGSLLPLNTEGLDFVLTAMFVVIFLEHWLKAEKHITHLLGAGVSVLCLLLFGADSFLIPTMLGIHLLLTAFRGRIERRRAE
ncbi:MAG: AzlC family ABC transporter permease [Oscillibacter sp.]|nr:AzlC family ABC transporter permease [Oscillibacter sp.]